MNSEICKPAIGRYFSFIERKYVLTSLTNDARARQYRRWKKIVENCAKIIEQNEGYTVLSPQE